MFSVVMASLNSGAFVERAVASALEQEGIELEVLVQDGGSEDETLEVLDRFADPRLSVGSTPDGGQSEALNRAISRSRGEWIVWLNADDSLAEGALALAVEAATGTSEVIIGDFETIDEHDDPIKLHRGAALDRRRLLTHGCYVFSGAVFVRRSVFARLGLLNPRLHFAMDYEFFLRIAPHVSCHHLPHALARYRVHPATKTSSRPWGTFQEAGNVRRHYARTLHPRPRWEIGQSKLALYYASRSVWRSDWWTQRQRTNSVRSPRPDPPTRAALASNLPGG